MSSSPFVSSHGREQRRERDLVSDMTDLSFSLFLTSSLCQFRSHTELESDTEERVLLFITTMVKILCFICKILMRSLKQYMHA